MLKQVVDGFTYNTMLQYLPVRYFPDALAQLDILRRAANFRARWWVVPDDLDQPIAPYDTLYYQVSVAPGSYFWGYNFAVISATDPDGDPTEVAATDMLVQAVDSCTGIPLFMDFAIGAGLHTDYSARCLPILLTQPRLILEPGLVNVEISNRTENTITCQLLMHFAETCKVITEEERVKVWAARRP